MTLSLSGERISLAGAPAAPTPPATYAYPSPGLAVLDDVVDDSYSITIKGDPQMLFAHEIVEMIESTFDVIATIEGETP